MFKGMIPAMIACFFGAALAAACDPNSFGRPGVDGIPTLGLGDDLANPGACAEAKTEQACRAEVTCVWAGERCAPMDFAGRS